jgi:hypothetical protein
MHNCWRRLSRLLTRLHGRKASRLAICDSKHIFLVNPNCVLFKMQHTTLVFRQFLPSCLVAPTAQVNSAPSRSVQPDGPINTPVRQYQYIAAIRHALILPYICKGTFNVPVQAQSAQPHPHPGRCRGVRNNRPLFKHQRRVLDRAPSAGRRWQQNRNIKPQPAQRDMGHHALQQSHINRIRPSRRCANSDITNHWAVTMAWV